MITRNKHDLSPQRVNSTRSVGWLHFCRARREGRDEGEEREERVGGVGGGDRLLKQVIILSASAIDFERWQESITE